MSKKVIGLIIALLAVILLAVTCPDKQSHTDAVKSMVSDILKEEYGADDSDEDSYGLFELGSLIISPVIGAITENNLEVDNYVVVSVGKVTYEGQTGVVTIGLLNNVFTPGKEKVREALREAFE